MAEKKTRKSGAIFHKIKDITIISESPLPFTDQEFIRDYIEASEQVLLKMAKFRYNLLDMKGAKKLFLSWDQAGCVRYATIEFDDELKGEAYPFLDEILFFCYRDDIQVYVEVTTHLSLDGQPVLRLMGGEFEQGLWFPFSPDEVMECSVTDQYDGYQKPFPTTWRFETFDPVIDLE